MNDGTILLISEYFEFSDTVTRFFFKIEADKSHDLLVLESMVSSEILLAVCVAKSRVDIFASTL
jgi:hypothetical protein